MVNISVNGRIAQGGGKLFNESGHEYILFDLIENVPSCDGFDDFLDTHYSWFHCCFEIKEGDQNRAGSIPEGCEIFTINSSGYAMITQTIIFHLLHEFPHLQGEQVIGFIKEGRLINVRGQELLLKGKDDKMMRTIIVDEIWFQTLGTQERPHILQVPYRSDWHYIVEM